MMYMISGVSMDWFKRKLTGKHHISWENRWFPVGFRFNQSIQGNDQPWWESLLMRNKKQPMCGGDHHPFDGKTTMARLQIMLNLMTGYGIWPLGEGCSKHGTIYMFFLCHQAITFCEFPSGSPSMMKSYEVAWNTFNFWPTIFTQIASFVPTGPSPFFSAFHHCSDSLQKISKNRIHPLQQCQRLRPEAATLTFVDGHHQWLGQFLLHLPLLLLGKSGSLALPWVISLSF